MKAPLQSCWRLGIAVCLAMACIHRGLLAFDYAKILIRPEFGPMHIARFHVDAIHVSTGSNRISGYEVKMYQIEPHYLDLGTFSLSGTDKANAYALMFPAVKLPYGIGKVRYRLTAIQHDGKRIDLGSVDQQLQRVILRGIRPLRVEWVVK